MKSASRLRAVLSSALTLSLLLVHSVHSQPQIGKEGATAIPHADILTVRSQMADWWGYWYQQNDSAAARLQSDFDRDWDQQPDAHRLPLTGEDSSEFLREYDMRKAIFLCSWKTAHNQANPKPLAVCDPGTTLYAEIASHLAQQREIDGLDWGRKHPQPHRSFPPLRQGEHLVTVKPDNSPVGTAEQRAYLSDCNKFAWRGDRIRCEIGADRTLRIYQRSEPTRGDSEADTVKYLINHPEKLKSINRAGFDRMEVEVIDGNGPGRNSTTTISVRANGTFSVTKLCYDETDHRQHCDPSN